MTGVGLFEILLFVSLLSQLNSRLVDYWHWKSGFHPINCPDFVDVWKDDMKSDYMPWKFRITTVVCYESNKTNIACEMITKAIKEFYNKLFDLAAQDKNICREYQTDYCRGEKRSRKNRRSLVKRNQEKRDSEPLPADPLGYCLGVVNLTRLAVQDMKKDVDNGLYYYPADCVNIYYMQSTATCYCSVALSNMHHIYFRTIMANLSNINETVCRKNFDPSYMVDDATEFDYAFNISHNYGDDDDNEEGNANVLRISSFFSIFTLIFLICDIRNEILCL